MNILFISYYFKPEKTVAAQRATYWAENFKHYIPESSVDVITTSEQFALQNNTINNVIVVPDNEKGVLSRLFKTDKGATWFYALKKHFDKAEKRYDVVILTGNPFLHFFIAKQLKNKFDCKIILDFRDPFAKNERGSASANFLIKLKKKILVAIEYYFCSLADRIITMNEHCSDLLCSNRKDIVSIIDNGYDEKSLAKASPLVYFKESSQKTLLYLGSFATDRSINNVLIANELISPKFRILHIGRPDQRYVDDRRITSAGLMPYNEAISYAKTTHIGLILASGKKFESTTKIFDYIGLNLPILIVTNGDTHDGNIQEVVKNYPLVWWAKNNVESIRQSLETIINYLENNVLPTFNSDNFSREKGLKDLVSIVKEL